MNKKQSIKNKILIVPMIVMIIVVATISTITIIVSNKIMLNQMKHDGMALSKQLAGRISESKSYSNLIGDMLIDKLLGISNRINDTKQNIDDDYVKRLCVSCNVDEINITDKLGKVIFSNKKECKNKVFKNNTFVIQALKEASPRFEKIRKCMENNNYYKYGYYKINTGGIIQVGIEANKLSKLNQLTDLNNMVKKISNAKEIEYALILDKNLKILAHSDTNMVGNTLDDLGSKTAIKDGKPYISKYLYEKNNEIVYDVVYPIYVDGKLDGAVDLGLCMESLNAEKKHILITIVLIALICVVVLYAVVTKICKGIVDPIEKLVYISREVADGNLVVEINSNSNDEIGVLSLGFKKMCDRLKNTIGIIKDESIKVNSMSNELNSNMNNINVSSYDIAKAIQDVAEGTLEQNKDIVNSIGNMDELSRELDNINDKLINIKNLSDNTENKAKSGKEDINVLLKSIKQVEGSFNIVYKKIYELNNSVLQIESITDVINSISEQTNLLALNAAIEAARAGESGKGFAIVAEEVRKLADQSKKSINDIKNLILGIEDESKNVIDTSEKVNNLVKEQSGMIETTLDSLNDMLNSVENINPLITDVYQSIENTIKSKDTVAEKLNNISIVSEKTSTTSQEIAAASEEMSASATEVLSFTNNMKQISENLNDETNKFSLK